MCCTVCRLENPKCTNQQHMIKRSFYTHILLSFFMSAKILEGIWVMWFSSNRLKQRICKRNGYQKHNVFKMSETKHLYIQKMRISLRRRSRHFFPQVIWKQSADNKPHQKVSHRKFSTKLSVVQDCLRTHIGFLCSPQAIIVVKSVAYIPLCLCLHIPLWSCPHKTTQWSIRLLANPTITGLPTFEIHSSELISGFKYMV